MKRSTLSLLVVASLMVLARTGLAQCPTTVPDCPGSPWIYGGYITVKVYNPSTQDSCDVYVAYCYRNACGYYDYFIKAISFGPCLNGMTTSEVLRAARDAFMKANPEDFPCAYPDEPGELWRFFTSACYIRTTSPEGETTLTSCEGDAWCYAVYTTGCDLSGNLILLETDSGIFGEPDCEEGPGKCNPICDML